MTLKEQLAALRTKAAELATKAQAGTITADEVTEAESVVKEIGDLQDLIVRQEAVAKSLAGVGAGPGAGSLEDAPGKQERTPGDEGDTKKSFSTLGEAFVKSTAYAAFKAANPGFGQSTGAGGTRPFEVKADNLLSKDTIAKAAVLGTATTGNSRAVRTNEVVDLVFRPQRTLLDLITRGTTNLSWFQYRQVVTKVNNASIVAEAVANDGVGVTGGVKPLSTLTTNTAEAKAFTYADGMEVTNQELSDDGIIQSLIDSTLRENLEIELEDVLLNGAGTADEPAGILNTTGVLQQAFVTDVPTTVRKAITKLRVTAGAQIQGVVFNPADDEAWDLLKDTQNRYLGNGPFGSGPNTAWGYERITSQKLPVGLALAGDFRVVQLLILEALTVLAFNQHKDYAQRNLTYIRAELRALQVIRQPAKLCVIDLAA